MTATLWSAAVFRRFWGKRECPSALGYDANLRAAEHRCTPRRKRRKRHPSTKNHARVFEIIGMTFVPGAAPPQ
jgi:hypothetical protein